MVAISITLAQARHSWLERQHLTGVEDKSHSLAELVGKIGWIPMPSPATPYLALFARSAITTRAELDDAAGKRGDLAVVPGPRGSSWLVPTADAPLARAFAVADHASREARVAAAGALTSRDLEGARDVLRAALEVPIAPEQLRRRIPDHFLRSLGDAGRKCGLPTVAALVLRSMWVTGEISRVPTDGRLDRGGALWTIDPHPRTVPTAADAVVSIAPRWLTAHGPMSPRAFAAAFGIAAGRANNALKALRPVEIAIEGIEGTLLAPGDFVPPTELQIRPKLLPVRDPLTDAQLEGFAAPGTARLVLTRNHGVGPVVLLGSDLIGTWAYDEIAHVVTWRSIHPAMTPEVSTPIDEEAHRLASFIAGELAGAPLHTIQTARQRPSSSHDVVSDLAIEI